MYSAVYNIFVYNISYIFDSSVLPPLKACGFQPVSLSFFFFFFWAVRAEHRAELPWGQNEAPVLIRHSTPGREWLDDSQKNGLMYDERVINADCHWL